ncbi:MAG: hypothetical protein PUK54_05900 [Firmicutes bacterium]|nr:hypothetical protein [Bacillota bacterium]MDD7602122.1 hypothetical protein [Bacillota bacterium]
MMTDLSAGAEERIRQKQNMAVVFSKVVSIFLIIGVGLLANKRGILPESSSQFLVDLLILITSPCMILTSITGKELTDATMVLTLQAFFCAVLYFLALSLVGYTLFGKILLIPLWAMIMIQHLFQFPAAEHSALSHPKLITILFFFESIRPVHRIVTAVSQFSPQ